MPRESGVADAVERQVLGNRHRQDQALSVPVLRNHAEAERRSPPTRRPRHVGVPVQDPTTGRRAESGKHLDQLRLPVSVDPDHCQDLALVDLEGDPRQTGGPSSAGTLTSATRSATSPGFRRPGRGARSASGSRPTMTVATSPGEEFGRPPTPDEPSATHHGEHVRDVEHLCKLVGDENDGSPFVGDPLLRVWNRPATSGGARTVVGSSAGSAAVHRGEGLPGSPPAGGPRGGGLVHERPDRPPARTSFRCLRCVSRTPPGRERDRPCDARSCIMLSATVNEGTSLKCWWTSAMPSRSSVGRASYGHRPSLDCDRPAVSGWCTP